MALRKRGEVWWLDVQVRGQRIRESTQLADKVQAQEYHDKRKAELYDKIESGKTLGDAIKLWLKIKPRSVNERNAIKQLLRIYPNRALIKIAGVDLHDALLDKSAANAERILNNIRAALKLAHERKWCDEIKIPKREINEQPTRFLTMEDWKRLEKELQPHVLVMAKFALATGLRLSNVTQLKWVNVNLEKKLAWVEAEDAKGGTVIPVPLSDNAVEILKSQIGKHGAYVFVYRNKPVHSVKTSWKKALVRANIFLVGTGKQDKDGKEIMKSIFRWHDLRHTWASWHAMNGTPIPVLKELGGWSDVDLVMRYAHLAPDHIRKYADNSGTE